MATAGVLPLEKRMIPVNKQNGLHKEAPAIHKVWLEARSWTRYEVPEAAEIHLPGAEDSWLSSASILSSELSWLLRLPCHSFWSQLCHDESLARWLAEMMETFPREHDRPAWWTVAVREAHNKILQKLFLVHVRICTYKESSQDFFSPEYWGDLLQEKSVVGLPRILDMCVLFAPCNKSITSKMVANVFKHQPQFYNDLEECSFTMLAALDSCHEQFVVLSMSQPHMTEHSCFVDMVTYCLDISVCLHSLVEVYPPSCHVLHQTGLDVKLGAFYTHVLVPLSNLIQKYSAAGRLTEEEAGTHQARARTSRHLVLHTVRNLVTQLCLIETINISDRVETYLTLITSLLSDIGLLTDYNKLYPIREEFELFESQQVEVDVVRKHYILDMFNSTQTTGFVINSQAGAVGGVKEAKHQARAEPEKVEGACAVMSQPSSVQLESLISSVRDLLPHLGEGFVEQARMIKY